MSLNQGGSLFRPPQGLQPNEEVLWVQQSETRNSGKSGVVSMMLVGSLFLASGLYYNILPILGIGILIIIGGIFVGYQSKTQGGVRYYLTNFRFVKSNHGRIVTELPRRTFRGKSFQQFLSVFKAPLQRGPVGNVRRPSPQPGHRKHSHEPRPTTRRDRQAARIHQRGSLLPILRPKERSQRQCLLQLRSEPLERTRFKKTRDTQEEWVGVSTIVFTAYETHHFVDLYVAT